MSRKLPEILTGLLVIVIAVAFLVYALGRAQALGGSGYPLKAQFSDIGGLAIGADVKIGGVKVGGVVDERLDPQTFAALVTMRIDNGIQLPTDSSASISSEGLLGGNYIGISPGGSDTMLKPGQSFATTQSAVNIENLIGQYIFNTGMKPGGSGSQGGAGASPNAGGNPTALPGTPGSK